MRLGGERILLGWGFVVDLVSCEVLVRSQNTNLTSYACHLCFFPWSEKISFPALISQHFPLYVSLTITTWSLLSLDSLVFLLSQVTLVFEMSCPLLHLIMVSLFLYVSEVTYLPKEMVTL